MISNCETITDTVPSFTQEKDLEFSRIGLHVDWPASAVANLNENDNEPLKCISEITKNCLDRIYITRNLKITNFLNLIGLMSIDCIHCIVYVKLMTRDDWSNKI